MAAVPAAPFPTRPRGLLMSARRFCARVALLALFVICMSATAAQADVFSDPVGAPATTQGAPTIVSDKADYGPGDLVTLTGGNWQPAESVHVVVNDDGMNPDQPWLHDVTVVADETGGISDQFNLPNWFVANYSITATGDMSGSATSAFTDAITSNTTISSSKNPSARGESVTFTANVSCGVSCTFDPTHSVTFEEGAVNNKCNGGTTLATVPQSAFTGTTSTSTTATYTTSSLTSGTHTVYACYHGGGSGDRPGDSMSQVPVTQTVNTGPAAQLVFSVEPTSTTADTAIAPAAQVSVEDADGTVVTGSTANITVAIGTNPGSATLGGTKTVAAVNGVASFSTLALDAAASGYTLTASSSGLTGDTSTAFNITKRTTSTSVSCFPTAVNLNQSTTCTATVRDTTAAGTPSAPTGTVSWANTGNGSGSFSGSPCTLANPSSASSSCSVTYTPATGSQHTPRATYSGSAKHNTSNGSSSVTINTLPATSVTVAPASGTVGGTTSLSATLKKTSDNSVLASKTISFKLNGTSVGTASTNASGVATLNSVSLTGIAVGSYPGAAVAQFAGD